MKTDNKTIKPMTAGNAAEGGIKRVILLNAIRKC